MGALRINKVDGTSDFIDLSGYSSASLDTSGSSSIITLTPIDPGIGNTIVTISRFITTPQESVWRSATEAAYNAIRNLPIEYGYPQLGSDPNLYREYDAVKIATNAIQGALGSSSSDEIVYSEITAIAENVDSISKLKELDALVNEQINIADTLRAKTIDECRAVTESGDTYTGNGCNCEPLAGPAANDPCCEACGEAVYKSELLKIIDIVGPISKKHQYLFENVAVNAPA